MKKIICVIMCFVFVFVTAFSVSAESVVANGVDVSKWQGDTIDWKSIKSDGYSFVIIRAGNTYTKDIKYEQNYAGAKAAGVNVGAYMYSYALTVKEAEEDAEKMLGWLKGKQFEYPIYYDMEDDSQLSLSTRARTDIALAFINKIQSAGYYGGIYANQYWFENYLYLNEIQAVCDTWIAHYKYRNGQWTDGEGVLPDYSADGHGLYQYSSEWIVPGITNYSKGTVDVDVAYRDYPTIMQKYGYNGYPKLDITTSEETLIKKGADWYYVKNGMPQYNTTTLCYYYGTWYYVENGKVNFSANTLCYYGGTWYYVKNGKVDFNATEVVSYEGSDYYVQKGVLRWGVNGLTYVNGVWYYLNNSVVNKKYDSLVYYGGTYYYVRNGKIDFSATTLVKYGNTWYYVQKGQLKWGAETLVNYYGTWYYVKNSQVDFGATTLVKYGDTWYYVQKGVLKWGAETLVNYYGTWYYVKNSQVDFKATTIVNYYGTWYYVKNGIFKSGVNTTVKYNGKRYIVRNGIVKI